tara:strand:+ start:562 stop:687 length:126 start_codon:yes stop_codon:yes gene_type:complete
MIIILIWGADFTMPRKKKQGFFSINLCPDLGLVLVDLGGLV